MILLQFPTILLPYIFLKLFFLQLCIRKSNYLLFQEGATLIQGVMFIVFAIYSRAMFIQGGTFIPESRVGRSKQGGSKALERLLGWV